jgi:putative RNA 2'-phosphotransferase
MPERRGVALSKLLSFVLRHDPASIGLSLDREGWAKVDLLLEALERRGHRLDRAELEALVRESDKQRFALSADGALIRANQGHSVEVELGYTPLAPPDVLYHGTVARCLPPIREHGLKKGARHHVHLSATRELAEAVGRRRGAPVVLEVDAARMAEQGHEFFRSENGVWLTSHVPPEFIRESPAGRTR